MRTFANEEKENERLQRNILRERGEDKKADERIRRRMEELKT